MRKTLIAIAAALSVVACSTQPKLVILHFNDTHSHYEPQRAGADAGLGGIVERAAFVDSVRQAWGDQKVLLVHAGDFNQGSSYFSEFHGDFDVDAVNALGYDCITLGNHEFDNGLEDLARRLGRITCPVVCANVNLPKAGLDSLVTPYTIIERGGMKIGIIGLAPNLSANLLSSIASRIEQYDNAEVTNRYAAELRALGCDMVILLSHLGYVADEKLIPVSHGLDLVIGGHSHTFVDDMVWLKDADGRKVGMVTDGCFGLQAGEIKIY